MIMTMIIKIITTNKPQNNKKTMQQQDKAFGYVQLLRIKVITKFYLPNFYKIFLQGNHKTRITE